MYPTSNHRSAQGGAPEPVDHLLTNNEKKILREEFRRIYDKYRLARGDVKSVQDRMLQGFEARKKERNFTINDSEIYINWTRESKIAENYALSYSRKAAASGMSIEDARPVVTRTVFLELLALVEENPYYPGDTAYARSGDLPEKQEVDKVLLPDNGSIPSFILENFYNISRNNLAVKLDPDKITMPVTRHYIQKVRSLPNLRLGME